MKHVHIINGRVELRRPSIDEWCVRSGGHTRSVRAVTLLAAFEIFARDPTVDAMGQVASLKNLRSRRVVYISTSATLRRLGLWEGPLP